MVWRDGRVAEGARLESVYRGNLIEGSNPSLSATPPIGGCTSKTDKDLMNDDVIALHDAHHDRLHDHVFGLLEALVDVDTHRARVVFKTLCDELETGLRLEDDVVIPIYKTQPLRSPQGRADHVEGDHVILRRTIAAIDAWLDELGASPTRRRVLAGLPVVYRLLGTLEHHHEREKLHLYPVVAPLLEGALLDETLAVLRRLVAGDARP